MNFLAFTSTFPEQTFHQLFLLWLGMFNKQNGEIVKQNKIYFIKFLFDERIQISNCVVVDDYK